MSHLAPNPPAENPPLPASTATQQLVDEEVRRIVDGAEDDVVELLKRERGRLDALARALLERETLDQPEAYEVAGVELPKLGAEEEAKAAAGPSQAGAIEEGSLR